MQVPFMSAQPKFLLDAVYGAPLIYQEADCILLSLASSGRAVGLDRWLKGSAERLKRGSSCHL